MEMEDGGYATTDEELDSEGEAGDVELDLKLWLKQLDAPTNTLTKSTPSKCKSSGTSAGQTTKVQKQADVDFSSILGELDILDEQFADLEGLEPPPPASSSSSSSVKTKPKMPPAKPSDAPPAQGSNFTKTIENNDSQIGDEFGDINSLLMSAISELDKLADESKTTSDEGKNVSSKDVTPQQQPQPVVFNKQKSNVTGDAVQHHVGTNRGVNGAAPPPVMAKPPVDKPRMENRKLPERPVVMESVPQKSEHPKTSVSQANGKAVAREEVINREDALSVKSYDSRSSTHSLTQSNSSVFSSGRSTVSENTPQVCVKVFSPDGSSKSVLVDDCTTVGHLCEILIQKNLADRSQTWGITEQIPELFMQRLLEDHHFILEETKGWPKQSSNRLVFVETPKKYNMFDRNRTVDENSWEQKELEGWLHLKSDGKKAWKKWNFFLKNGGIFYQYKGKKGQLTCLRQLNDVEVYMGVAWKKKFKAPTDFGIALKPPLLQKKTDEEIKYLCADDSEMMWKWVTAIRMAKYGYQLYRNFRQSIWMPDSGLTKSGDQKIDDSHRNLNQQSVGHQRTCSNVAEHPVMPDDFQHELSTLRRGSDDSARGGSVSGFETTVTSKMKAQIPITGQTARLLSMQPTSTVQTLPRTTSRVESKRFQNEHTSLGDSLSMTLQHQRSHSGFSVPITDLPPPPPELLECPMPYSPGRSPVSPAPHPPLAGNSSARKLEPPPPPRRDQSTKLSFKGKDNNAVRENNPIQTKNFVLNLQRAIGQKQRCGAGGIVQLEMPLPPPPVYSDEPSYLDLGELPPPPAELLEELKMMRKKSRPPPPPTLAKQRSSKLH